MFNIGELIIYSAQGICSIDDICEKKYYGVTRRYYVLHPIENDDLTINIPVDNDKVKMLEIIDQDEAKEIIESFKFPGVNWINMSSRRSHIYSKVLKEGNREEISKVVNTLMRRKYKARAIDKKLCKRDSELLECIQNVLFKEIAISLNTTFEAVYEKIADLIIESEKQVEA